MEIISFNSYKGGSCRTTTCYNAIPFLARELNATSKNPIIVFDCDLDSMGLTNLLFPTRTDEEEGSYSSRNLFCDENTNEIESINNSILTEPYFKKYKKVGDKFRLTDDGAVLFLGVNRNDATISDEQFAKFKNNPPIKKLVTALQRLDKEFRPSALVFDCASGVQMTTIAVLGVAEKIAMCMRPTSQARVGTFMYLKDKLPSILETSYEGDDKKVFLLLTSVPLLNVDENDPNREAALKNLKTVRHKSLEAIEQELVEQIKGMGNRKSLYYELNDEFARVDDDIIGIPEVERFKWEECLLYETELFTNQEEVLRSRYADLARILCNE